MNHREKIASKLDAYSLDAMLVTSEPWRVLLHIGFTSGEGRGEWQAGDAVHFHRLPLHWRPLSIR